MASEGEDWLTRALSQERGAPIRSSYPPRTASAPPMTCSPTPSPSPWLSSILKNSPATRDPTSHPQKHVHFELDPNYGGSTPTSTRFVEDTNNPRSETPASQAPTLPSSNQPAIQAVIRPLSHIKRVLDLLAALRAELSNLFSSIEAERQAALPPWGPDLIQTHREQEETLLRLMTTVNAGLGECVTLVGREGAKAILSQRGGVRLWVR